MWIDLKPLKCNRDFRYAYFGQFVSFFGTMMSWVALPYQIYHLTSSTLAVGLLGIVELIPLLLTAFIGGTLADVLDRRKLLIRAEIGMAIVFFLILAGGADCVSGIFRTTIWNETIPDKLRGRMASLEMVSYTSGPLLGNAQVGFLASMTSAQCAILLGGILCVIAVCISIFLLPAFWKYCANPQKGEI